MSAEPKFEVVKSDLDELKHLCLELDEHRLEFVALAEKTTAKAIRAGQLLEKFKKEAGRGKWLLWIKDNLSIHQTTASRWMQLYKRSLKLSTVLNLPLTQAYKLIADTNADGTPRAKKKRGKSGGGKGAAASSGPAAQGDLPLESKAEESKPAAETLEFIFGPDERFVITKPLSTWRVINSPGYSRDSFKTHQAMLCTQCWCYRTSGFLYLGERVRQYRFSCDCENSEREATSEKVKKQKPKK